MITNTFFQFDDSVLLLIFQIRIIISPLTFIMCFTWTNFASLKRGGPSLFEFVSASLGAKLSITEFQTYDLDYRKRFQASSKSNFRHQAYY